MSSTIISSFEAKDFKLFKALINNALDVICLVDQEANVKFISPSVKNLLGFEPEEIVGKNGFEMVHPDDLSFSYGILADLLKKPGSSIKTEIRILTKDNNWKWIEVSALNLLNDEDLNSILINYTDIEERISAEKGIKESEERFRGVIEQTGQLVYDYNIETGEIKWSGAIETITGYSEKEFQEFDVEKWADFIHPEDREFALSLLDTKIKTGGSYTVEYRFRRKAGDYIYIFDKGAFLIDSEKKAIRMLGAMSDISSRKKAEKIQDAVFKISEAAHLTENLDELYSSIHAILNDIIYAKNFYIAIIDSEKQILTFPYFIDEMEDAPGPVKMGNGLTEYVLRTEKPLFASPEVFKELVEKKEIEAIGGESIDWLGVPLKSKDKVIGAMVIQSYEDSVRFSHDEMNILLYVSNQVAMAIERKTAEDQLKNYTEELKESNANKDIFFSVISHDLKTPFISLLGLSEYLSEDAKILSKEEIVELSNSIHKSSKNLYALIDNLLQWSKLQFGKMDFSPEYYNFKDQVESIISVYESSFESKSVKINSAVNEDIFVYADRYMVDSILRNLFSNALKYSNIGGIVELKAEEIDTIVKISVSDEGVGMDDETIQNVFDSTKHFTTQGTLNEKGSGIGIELCKRFISFHGSRLRVESHPGKGSTFYFTLPAVKPVS